MLWGGNGSILHPSERLEDLRRKLSDVSGRPVYISANFPEKRAGKYLLPGKKKAKLLRWDEVYLSEYTSWGTRTPRRAKDAVTLVVDRRICFVLPWVPGDRRKDSWTWFTAIGLDCELSIDSIQVDSANREELCPYLTLVHTYEGAKRMSCTGLAFWRSVPVINPQEEFKDWSVRPPRAAQINTATPPIISELRPPGQYCEGLDDRFMIPSRWCFVFMKTGPCVVCHGKSGDEKHIGIVEHGPGGENPLHTICQSCWHSTAETFADELVFWDPATNTRGGGSDDPKHQ